MSTFEGTPEEILARVQQIVSAHVPHAVCELQDYKTQIGCGLLDGRNQLREIKWRVRGLKEFHVVQQAQALASHVAPTSTGYTPT